MSYNGSGTFNINTAGQPVVTGTVISSTAFNALTSDLGTGLSTAITKDGQTTATARIPFAAGINSSLVTDATSTTTGSIITAGGVGIAKSLYVGTGISGALNGTVGATTPSTGAFTTLSASDQIAGNNAASYQAIFKGWGPLESNSTAGAIVVGGSSQNSGRGEIHYWNNSSPAPALYIDNTRTAVDGKVVVRLKTSATAVEAATFNIYGIGLTGATPSSGTGITFPATQSASTDANTLDDYEEGTWSCSDNSGAALGVLGTGKYTKIGRLVYVEVYVTYPVTASAATSLLTGLPFTALDYNMGSISSSGAGAPIISRTSGGTTEIKIYAASNSQPTNAQLSNSYVLISLTYVV